MVYETYSAEETSALGEQIGREVKPGTVYTLVGDLGVGKTVFTQGIAKGLGISERTIKNHVSNIFKKIGVSDRTQAAVFAIRNNLINI